MDIFAFTSLSQELKYQTNIWVLKNRVWNSIKIHKRLMWKTENGNTEQKYERGVRCRQYLHVHAPVILVVILFAWWGHYGRVGDPCRMHAWWAQHQRVREPGGDGTKRRRGRREVWRKTDRDETKSNRNTLVSSEKCVESGAEGTVSIKAKAGVLVSNGLESMKSL